MAKVNYRTLPKRKRAQMEAQLHMVLHRLGVKEGAWELLRDLLTESEIIMLSRRLEVARWLLANHGPDDIAGQLGVGLSTVYGVDRWLQQKFQDYRITLGSIFKETDKDILKQFGKKLPVDPYSLRGLRKRYPAKSVLLNALLGNPDQYVLEG